MNAQKVKFVNVVICGLRPWTIPSVCTNEKFFSQISTRQITILQIPPDAVYLNNRGLLPFPKWMQKYQKQYEAVSVDRPKSCCGALQKVRSDTKRLEIGNGLLESGLGHARNWRKNKTILHLFENNPSLTLCCVYWKLLKGILVLTVQVGCCRKTMPWNIKVGLVLNGNNKITSLRSIWPTSSTVAFVVYENERKCL